MVYDEGFDFSFNNKDSSDYRSYFVFQKYGKNEDMNGSIKSKWVSYCYTTLVGWYHIGDQWGCVMGTKVGKSDTEITNGEAPKKQVVVEGSITEKSFMEKRTSKLKKKETFQSLYQNQLPSENRFVETMFQTRLELTADFKNHALVVDRINAMDYSWKAANYEEFEGLTILQLNKLAGRKKSKSGFFNFHENGAISLNDLFKTDSSNISKNSRVTKNNFKRNISNNNYDKSGAIPTNFNWMDHMGEPKSQGSCGSCFAVSTITMLEARLRKNYPELIKKYFGDPKKLSISLQHVLSCSITNQGCDGGYSYLVSKFFNEYDMVPTQCFHQGKGCNQSCPSGSELSKLKFSVSDYYYAGGSYGRTNEQNLLEEVYKNGPMVVSLEPEYSFMMYRSGVYDVNAKNWFKSNLSKPDWQKVDHSVLLVGWGEEEVKGKNVKYWLLQNSWGRNWGEAGYMKFKRGVDLLGIESIGEAAIPTLKEI
jgi:cathepsin C